MAEILDTKLLIDFQKGDHSAFKQVFSIYYPKLLYFSTRLTDSQEDAKDITMTAFTKLFSLSAKFETEVNIKAFLYICVRNACLSYFRSIKSKNEQEKNFTEHMQNEILLQYEYAIQDELLDRVHVAIENLPGECRKIFKMLYFDELKPAEVAEILQVSASTVYNQKSLALKALRLALGSEHSFALTLILHILIATEKSFPFIFPILST
jgi:RNA polymerase sigma-70 factor (family 1)